MGGRWGGDPGGGRWGEGDAGEGLGGGAEEDRVCTEQPGLRRSSDPTSRTRVLSQTPGLGCLSRHTGARAPGGP